MYLIKIEDKIPEKGRDIIGLDDNGKKHYCYRCACNNPKCTEWRDSIGGFNLMVNIVKWKYDD